MLPQISLAFLPPVFLCSRIPSRSPYFSPQVSFGSPCLCQFLTDFSCFLWLGQFGGILVSCCRVPLNWGLADVLLTVRLGLCVWGRETPGAKSRFHPIVSRVPAVCVTLTLVSWLRRRLSGVCTAKLLSLSPLRICALGKKAAPMSGVGGHAPPLWGGAGDLPTVFGILQPRSFVCSPQVFIYPVVYLYQCRPVGIYTCVIIWHNTTVLLKLFQLWPSGELSAGSCLPLPYPVIVGSCLPFFT